MSKSAVASPAHIAALSSRHAAIDARLEHEMHRPKPDNTLIARLKKAKLRLKDAMFGR